MIDANIINNYCNKNLHSTGLKFIEDLIQFRIQIDKYFVKDSHKTLALFDITEEQLEKELAIFILNNA